MSASIVTRSLRASALLALASVAGLAGCGDGGRDSRGAVRAAVEAALGPPSQDRLAERETFRGAGVSFQHPAPLNLEHRQEEGDDVWFFSHGLYELELWASDGVLDARDYLQGISMELVGQHGGKVVQPLGDGRTLTLCGQPVVSKTMRLEYLGGVTAYESFALPPDAAGRGRLLTVSDEIHGDRPSSTAVATETALFATLRCEHDTGGGDAAPRIEDGDPA